MLKRAETRGEKKRIRGSTEQKGKEKEKSKSGGKASPSPPSGERTSDAGLRARSPHVSTCYFTRLASSCPCFFCSSSSKNSGRRCLLPKLHSATHFLALHARAHVAYFFICFSSFRSLFICHKAPTRLPTAVESCGGLWLLTFPLYLASHH